MTEAIFCCSNKLYADYVDPAKNDRNVAERGLSFERVAELDWPAAIAVEDVRRDYGERRVRVLAPLKAGCTSPSSLGGTTPFMSSASAGQTERK